ncbi:MAG: hypothetical protein KC620_24110, partial [Myxococcales bacterium]|nr:hypothetical protein [Myxococcales bacterium]
DRFGSWYWIDASARAIRVQSAGTDQTTLFWSLDAPPATAAPAAGAFHDAAPAPAAPGRLVSLAVTRTHYLIVGTRAPDGLLLFDLHGAGGPLPIAAPIDFAPFDMAATPDGGVWLLDREHARLWRFDRRLDLVPAPAPLPDGPGFGPVDGDPGPRPRRVAPEQQALDLGDGDFVALCALPDCAVLLLEQTAQRARLRSVRAGVLGPAVDLDAHVRPFLDATDPRRTSDAPLVGHDLAFVPAAPDADHLGHLYVSDLGGWQVYAFTVRWAGEALAVTLVPAHYPMRLFAGKALVAHDGRVWYDLEDRFVPLIEQRRACYRREGRFTHVFDGEQPALVWHRLMLDGHFPLTTALAVRLRAADTPGALPDAPFLPQPRPLRRRATELPFVRRDDPCDAATVELFLHGATGRYLEIEVTLTSDGRSTPRLRSLRAWYPRFSYLDEYLPAVYREDPDSARFLTGFLGNLEGFYTAIEHRIETVQALFNPDAAPTEALDWLAAWLGVALDPAWEEGRRRLFIRHAVDFYRWRGTAHGLSMALQLAFGQCVRDALFAPPGVAKLDRGIRIIEQFRTRNAPAVGAGAGAARPSDRWHPADGAADLHARYRTFHDPPAGTAVQYPLSPADAARPLWSAFSRAVLGFEPQAQGTAAHRAL